MKKFLLVTALFAAAELGVNASSCAFDLGGLTSGLTGGSSKGGGADLSATQDRTVMDYVVASKLLISANKNMSKALGLDQDAAKMDETASAMTEGTSKDSIQKADEAISESTAHIADALKTHPQLSAESKATFGLGLADLATGTISYVKVAKDVSGAQSSISSASPMELMKLGELVYLAKSVPADIKNYSGALTSAIAFAKDNHIKVPDNAAAATDALGSM